MTKSYAVEGQISLSDVDGWCGKTCQEHFQQIPAETSKKSSRKSSKSLSRTLPMFLYLTRGSGASRDASWVTEKTDALFPSLGEFTMDSFGEQPKSLMDECCQEGLHKDVSVSHLSQILEDSALPKYYLSVKACRGILNRAEKRGKELPKILKEALENQIARGDECL